MVRENNGEKDITVKKRRSKGSSNSSLHQSSGVDTDVYQRRQPGAKPATARCTYKAVIDFEEGEAASRDPENDTKLFCNTCDEIRKLMGEIAILKTKNTEAAAAEISEKQISASLLFVVLKKLNRLEKFRTKNSRDVLNREKLQVDSYHLQLQNLLYEILHLKKEVTKCLQFKSKDEEIELVPVEEFYQNAPPSVSREMVTRKDEHQLKLARLEWELEQRKELAALCHRLQADKEKVAREIQSKRERLDNLTPQLKSILEVTKPLQDYLGLPLDKIRKQHQVAYLLPKPLYVLYVQVDAYREACDSMMTVSVTGDEEEARHLKQSLDETSAFDESDSDQEELGDCQTRHHRKLSRVDRLEERKKKLLMKHPLTVDIHIKLQDENSLFLSFQYLMHLHIVTVNIRVSLVQSVHGVSAGDLIAPHNILTALFPQDLGTDSPNVANHYQLQQLGLEPFPNYIGELGLPYLWAQRLAGLDFTGQQINEAIDKQGHYVEPKDVVSQVSVEKVIKAIRHRLKARLALCRQVQALETGLVLVPHSLRTNFPSKLCSCLSSWQLISWDDYRESNFSQMLVREGVVCSSDTFYRAVLNRGTAKLIALIAVKSDYPRMPTLFSLLLNWHGDHTANNNDCIRDMEVELNVHWRELVLGAGWGHTLLACQLMRLMVCLDIFLETSDATGSNPPEFSRDKIFIKPVRGRNRCRPYKYLQVGGGIFTQR